ncbi:MAG: hypothetical protein MUF73_04740 [Rhodobacteraceae bacterium]|nr:hypothetical protein [Paracoccaceae bacterium]
MVHAVVATMTLGLAAAMSSGNMIADQPNKDIWPHAAAVRALMGNLSAPLNPFVVSPAPSRHFHPLWVATAALGKLLGLTVWQAVTVATWAIMATLAVAVHVFARALFASPWAPVVLLSVMLFGWALPYEHTGLHSYWTLLYGAAYPATLLIALSLLQWAAVIRALGDLRHLPGLVAVSALMLATHQLGAVIGCIGAVSFALAQPDAPVARRVAALAAIGLGLALALAWPYVDPLELMLRPGNSAWEGGPDFYAPPWMPQILVPAVLGVLALRQRSARPLALALGLYGAAYLTGLTGAQVASRFLMPVVLVLHVGLAWVILDAMPRFAARWPVLRRWAPALAVVGVAALVAQAATGFQAAFDAQYRAAPDVYAAAERLVQDVPDTEPVAALGLTAWPVVAAGQRVLSVPWPEPGIADLAARQAMTAALFDATQSPEARAALAGRLGIRVLLVDRRRVPPDLIAALTAEARATVQDGPFYRFDLR